MNLTSVKDWTEVRGALREHGHDFWASCLAHATPLEMADKLQTMRVDGDLFASEAFTDAYVAPSGDVKADLNALIDEFGLGLRRKRARSGSEPGCVVVLVSRDGPSALKRRRMDLPSDDRALSTEERLRRTKLRFEVVSSDQLSSRIEESKADFWLTAYTGADTEACKKKVITMQVDGVPVAERFSRCLLATARNCQEATDRLCGVHGLGGRKSAVRSKPEPGCLALLLRGGGAEASMANSDDEGNSSTSASSGSSSGSSSSSNSSDSEPASSQEEWMTGLAEELFGMECKDHDGPLLPLLPLAFDDPPPREKPRKAPAKPSPPRALPAPAQTLALALPAAREASRSEQAPALREEEQQEEEEEIEGTMRHGRWGELKRLGLTCVALDDWTEVCSILPDLGHDFWVGCVGCSAMDEVAAYLSSMKVEDHPVVGTFTHCYVAKSRDVKADLASVIDEFGLGLRKQRSHCTGTSGHVYLLACRKGPSALAGERAKLEAFDRKLSTEERVRRTHLQFEASTVQAMSQQARRNLGSFCATAFTGANFEACKRRVMTFELQGVPAAAGFARCLIAEVPNCREATQRLEREAGIGCRRSSVRSSRAAGCVALLMPKPFAERAARTAAAAGSGLGAQGKPDSRPQASPSRTGMQALPEPAPRKRKP